MCRELVCTTVRPGPYWCSRRWDSEWPTSASSAPDSACDRRCGFGPQVCQWPFLMATDTLALEWQDGDHWVVGSISDPYTDIPSPDVEYKVSAAC